MSDFSPVLLLFEIGFGVLLILAVRLMFGPKLGPRTCRLLWLLIIFRALIPVSVPLAHHPTGLFVFERKSLTERPNISFGQTDFDNFAPPASSISESPIFEPTILETKTIQIPKSDRPAPLPEQTIFHASFFHALTAIWFAGLIGLLSTAFFRSRKIIADATRLPTPVPDWVQEIFLELRQKLRLGAWPVLIVTPCVPTPCLVGALRPRILLPESLAENRSEAETLRFILLHEMLHLKSGDVWFSWLWTLTLAVHWFNPLFWFLGRWMKLDAEAACDSRVLEFLDSESSEKGHPKQDYAASLLHVLQTLNPPTLRTAGLSAVIETSSNLERRIHLMKSYKKPNVRRTFIGMFVLLFLAGLSLTGYAQKPKPISAEKAKLMGYVEDFFMNNYRDITMRKSLEWGDVQTDKDDNFSIRYKYDALIWDKEKITENKVWTFKKDGEFVSAENVEGFPKQVKIEKPDTSTKEGLQKLVEKFFSENYRDITARKTIEWGERETSYDQNRKELVSIRCKYEATIWNKEKIIQDKIWTFEKDGKFVSVKDYGPALESKTSDSTPSKEKTADEYLAYLVAEKFDKAREMGIDVFQKSISSEQLAKIWKQLKTGCGKYIDSTTTNTQENSGMTVLDKKCSFEKKDVLIRITVDSNNKIAGFFLMGVLPKTEEKTDKNSSKPVKIDSKASQRVAASGWRLFMQGKPDEAEPRFKEAVQLNPENANAYQGLGWAQTNQGLIEEAKETFKKCLELDPKNAAALNGLGVIARNEGDEKTMLDVWLRAVEADKAATGPMAGLADFYEKNGDRENARKYFELWNKADPTDENAKEGLERNK